MFLLLAANLLIDELWAAYASAVKCKVECSPLQYLRLHTLAKLSRPMYFLKYPHSALYMLTNYTHPSKAIKAQKS